MNDESRVQTHEIAVPRTARYAVLGADVSRAEELWLVCHGYGQLASRFIRRFGVLDNGRRSIVAPEALSRFYVGGGTGPHSADEKVGASWMTREGRDAEIADQVTYLDLVSERVLAGRDRAKVRLVAFGFSQGAATVCRWASRATAPPDDLILWGSGIPADVLESAAMDRLAGLAITIVIGTRDPIASDNRVAAHSKQLDAAGLSYRFVTFDGGHEIDGQVLRDVANP